MGSSGNGLEVGDVQLGARADARKSGAYRSAIASAIETMVIAMDKRTILHDGLDQGASSCTPISIGLALLLANEAVGATKSDPTPEAQSALLSALLASPRLKKILGGHETSVFARRPVGLPEAVSLSGEQLDSGQGDKGISRAREHPDVPLSSI
jgi:hypothetical protein